MSEEPIGAKRTEVESSSASFSVWLYRDEDPQHRVLQRMRENTDL